MRTSFRRALVLALALGTVSATVTFSETQEAHAFIKRVARAFRRVARRVVRTVRRVVRRVASRVKRVVRRVAHTVRRVVRRVARTVKKVVKKVGKVVKKVGKAVGGVLKKAVKFAGKVFKTLKDLVGGVLGCIKKLNFKCIWDILKEKIFGPIKEWFQKLKEKAKKAVKKLIEKAKKALGGIFKKWVINPALKWALGKLFGGSMGAKIKGFVQRILGSADAIAARGQEFAAVMKALTDRDLAAYKTAMAAFEKGLNNWTNIKMVDIVKKLIEYGKERLGQFIRAKTVELLDKAYGLVEAPIEAGKTAACNAIRAIPFVGGVLGGAVDFLLTQGLKLLRDMGFKWVGDKAAELVGKIFDTSIAKKIEAFVLRGAAKLDSFLQPVMNKIKPYIKEALKAAGVVQEKWFLLRDKLRKAGEILAKGRAAVQ